MPEHPLVGQMPAVLRRALFGVGPVATGRAIIRRLMKGDAADGKPGAGLPTRPHPFDAEHGTETGGFRSWRDLQSGGVNDPYISGYHGIAPSMARQVIALVGDPAAFTFLDLGCGKGRALAVASELPFRGIIGVEIAGELADAASRNAAILRQRYPARTPIEVVHGDAAEMLLPPGPLLLFLYQPFERPVMRAVARALAATLAEAPRPAVVVYIHPALHRIFDRLPALERVQEAVLHASEEDRPFGYGGGDPADSFMLWRTRAPRPVVARLG